MALRRSWYFSRFLHIVRRLDHSGIFILWILLSLHLLKFLSKTLERPGDRFVYRTGSSVLLNTAFRQCSSEFVIPLDALPSAETENRFRSAMEPLVLTSNVFQHIGDEEFVSAIGFDPMRVHQVLTAGSWPTEALTLIQGGVDIDALPAAWEAAGYSQETAGSGKTIWSLGTGAEVDPENPIQNRMFAALNNVTILDGDILAFGATLSRVSGLSRSNPGGTRLMRNRRGDRRRCPMVYYP